MGFPLSMPHVAPIDSPIGRWDRRCRVCSQVDPQRIRHRETTYCFSCVPITDCGFIVALLPSHLDKTAQSGLLAFRPLIGQITVPGTCLRL